MHRPLYSEINALLSNRFEYESMLELTFPFLPIVLL